MDWDAGATTEFPKFDVHLVKPGAHARDRDAVATVVADRVILRWKSPNELTIEPRCGQQRTLLDSVHVVPGVGPVHVSWESISHADSAADRAVGC